MPDLLKTHLPIQKRRHRDLICGIHHSGQCAAGLARPAREIQCRKILIPWSEKFQL